MYALTLWRPWARIVCTGEKRIENRPWAPPLKMLGKTIAIHAGVRMDLDSEPWISSTLGYDVLKMEHAQGIVGHATLVGWCDAKGNVLQEISGAYIRRDLTARDREWLVGPFGWMFRDAHLIQKPIPIRGFQKLWRLDSATEEKLRRAA